MNKINPAPQNKKPSLPLKVFQSSYQSLESNRPLTSYIRIDREEEKFSSSSGSTGNEKNFKTEFTLFFEQYLNISTISNSQNYKIKFEPGTKNQFDKILNQYLSERKIKSNFSKKTTNDFKQNVVKEILNLVNDENFITQDTINIIPFFDKILTWEVQNICFENGQKTFENLGIPLDTENLSDLGKILHWMLEATLAQVIDYGDPVIIKFFYENRLKLTTNINSKKQGNIAHPRSYLKEAFWGSFEKKIIKILKNKEVSIDFSQQQLILYFLSQNLDKNNDDKPLEVYSKIVHLIKIKAKKDKSLLNFSQKIEHSYNFLSNKLGGILNEEYETKPEYASRFLEKNPYRRSNHRTILSRYKSYQRLLPSNPISPPASDSLDREEKEGLFHIKLEEVKNKNINPLLPNSKSAVSLHTIKFPENAKKIFKERLLEYQNNRKINSWFSLKKTNEIKKSILNEALILIDQNIDEKGNIEIIPFFKGLLECSQKNIEYEGVRKDKEIFGISLNQHPLSNLSKELHYIIEIILEKLLENNNFFLIQHLAETIEKHKNEILGEKAGLYHPCYYLSEPFWECFKGKILHNTLEKDIIINQSNQKIIKYFISKLLSGNILSQPGITYFEIVEFINRLALKEINNEDFKKYAYDIVGEYMLIAKWFSNHLRIQNYNLIPFYNSDYMEEKHGFKDEDDFKVNV